MSQDYNLEDEFGDFLDRVEANINSSFDDELQHYGVKGMKWGRRKSSSTTPELKTLGPDKITRKTKSGEEITMTKIPPGAITRFLAKRSERVRNAVANSASLTIRNSEGKEVGYANMEKRSKDELYLNWIGINADSRGKGYATAVMKAAEGFGKEGGFKKMTLEVPGNSPDARHIYEKLGFKVTKEDKDPDDPVWGGLTSMEYSFDTQHGEHLREEDVVTTQLNTIDDVDDFLAHYGVKGMSWGKRKARDTGGSGGGQNGTAKPKPGMSRKKKIAIGIGIGATVAIGAAVAISVMNNKKANDMAISQIAANVSTMRGKSRFDMIANAAKMDAAANPKVSKQAEKTAKAVAEKVAAKTKDAIEDSPAGQSMTSKLKEAAINKAKDMAYERAKEQAMDKAKEYAIERAKSMLRPASSVPQKSVVFNPKTGLYEEVEGDGGDNS